jgi:hypothetical protein
VFISAINVEIDLPIGEHTVDTAGQTLAIGRLQLYQLGPASTWRTRYSAHLAAAGPADPNSTDRRPLERPAASDRLDEVGAHHRPPAHRQTARQQPPKQPGQGAARVRTAHPNHLRRYVADEELRRRVRRQLNKGESLHALRRNLFFAHQGHVRRRHLDDQIDQALCPTLVTNACVLWTTTYLADAPDALRGESFPVADELAAHLTPAQHDNFYATYSLDIDAELRREGHRPLRTTA